MKNVNLCARIVESSGDGFQTFKFFNKDFHENAFHNSTVVK